MIHRGSEAALDELDANGEDRIASDASLRRSAWKAKAHFKHGDFMRWCRETLSPSELVLFASPSIRSSRRLSSPRSHGQQRRDIAGRIVHRSRGSFRSSPIGKKQRAERAFPPKTRRKPAEIIADLRQQLADAEADFKALRDPLPPEVERRVAELATAARADNVAATDELKKIARQFHWRHRDLLSHRTCGAPQVSVPPTEEPLARQPETPKSEHSLSDDATMTNPHNLDNSSRANTVTVAGPEKMGALRQDGQLPHNGSSTDGATPATSPLSALLHSRRLAENSRQVIRTDNKSKPVIRSMPNHGGRDGF